MDLRGTATALRVLLWMGAVVGLVAVISGVVVLQFLNDIMAGRPVSAAEEKASEAWQGLIGVVWSALFVVTAVVWLRWLVCASVNTRVLATRQVRFTPGWSVAWYFIPILNLWRPFQVMQEIWQVSQEGARYHKPMGRVIVWWALFPTSVILRYVASWVMSDRYAATLVHVLADMVHVASCIAAMLLVSGIYRMQVDNLARHKAAAEAEADATEPGLESSTVS